MEVTVGALLAAGHLSEINGHNYRLEMQCKQHTKTHASQPHRSGQLEKGRTNKLMAQRIQPGLQAQLPEHEVRELLHPEVRERLVDYLVLDGTQKSWLFLSRLSTVVQDSEDLFQATSHMESQTTSSTTARIKSPITNLHAA